MIYKFSIQIDLVIDLVLVCHLLNYFYKFYTYYSTSNFNLILKKKGFSKIYS